MEIITNDRLQSWIKYIRAFLFISLILLISFFLFIGSIFIYAKSKGAPPLWVTQSSIIYASDGSIIGEAHNGEKRYWVSLEDISPNVIDATLAVEDRRFYDHSGFDYRRIVGAILADIKARAKVQGASTITQQYARNLFLNHEKTVTRKWNEALYTIRLEANYSKDEILEGYLNTIYYGHGAYGIESAAHYYFGKSASELTLAEASMLAGIPKGPNIFSPFINEERAEARQRVVLQSMVANGNISETLAKEAAEQSLQFGEREHLPTEYMAPYFQDAVRSVLRNELGLGEELVKGGLHIYTTLNPRLQHIAEQQIAEELDEESDIQVGFIAMDPQSGRVQALVGGRDYEESPFNRVTQAMRQPGSTFKPLLYYQALENGFTPSTPFRSERTTFQFDNGRASYTPHNYKDYYADREVPLMQALPVSDNIYAVKTHLYLGEEQLLETARKFGIHSPLQAVPALALGSSPVRVIEMANAFSMLANGGTNVTPIFIDKIVNYRGEVLFESSPEKEKVLDPDITFVLNHMMTGMFDRRLNGYMSVTGNSLVSQLSRPYAGKSGTTPTDSWMIGYTPQLLSAVWTGYDQNQPLQQREQRYTKNIWAEFMEEALEEKSVMAFRPTDGVVGVQVNPESGLLASKECPGSRLTYYVKGTEPTDYCQKHGEETEQQIEQLEKREQEGQKSWWQKFIPWL